MTTFEQDVQAVAEGIGADVALHARDVDGNEEIGVAADEPAVLASVFKVPVLVELARQIAAGEVDATARLRIPPSQRSDGPTGISVMLDDVELSVRDTALSMMSVSDNAATDIIMDLVGTDRIEKTMRELGLSSVTVQQTCRDIYAVLSSDIGAAPEELEEALADADKQAAMMERARESSVLDPAATNAATPADVTRLLQLIWTDEAGPPDACAEMRRILSLQVWPHRLRAGFPDAVKVAGKTGTLPYARNEAGVVEYPDGGRYAVAVFLRLESPEFGLPDADRAVGTLARMAVDRLRDGT